MFPLRATPFPDKPIFVGVIKSVCFSSYLPQDSGVCKRDWWSFVRQRLPKPQADRPLVNSCPNCTLMVCLKIRCPKIQQVIMILSFPWRFGGISHFQSIFIPFSHRQMFDIQCCARRPPRFAPKEESGRLRARGGLRPMPSLCLVQNIFEDASCVEEGALQSPQSPALVWFEHVWTWCWIVVSTHCYSNY